MSDGFKYAYLQFIKSYSRREYHVLDQMCEKNLLNAIKSEPLRNDELIKFKSLEKDEFGHTLVTPKNDQKILEFDVIDYNMNFGVSVDRS